jgi:lipid-binding SYLF domain-containing protein
MLHAQQRPAPPRRQAAEREQFVDRAAARTKKRTRRATAFQSAHRAVAAVMLAAATAVSGGCSRAEQPRSATAASVSPQQAIVDRSAAAIERLRSGSAGAELDRFLQRARGIMIFPRLVKASLIVGGEGGNGVLLARGADGSWSNPAFYSLAAPSVGLQIGYLEATVVLFIMEQKTLETALHSDVTLGSSSSVALGTLSEHRSEGEVYSKPIYQLLEARGAFVGASLDGYVISARNKHNQAYYGGQSRRAAF